MLILAGIAIYLILVVLITGCFNVGKGEETDSKERRLKWLMENGYTFEQATRIVKRRSMNETTSRLP
jgi:hypothetical protein